MSEMGVRRATEATTVGYDVGALGGPGGQDSPTRKLYRGDETSKKATNIMFDRRVVRGSTYSAAILTPSAQVEFDRKKRDEEERARRRAVEARRRAEDAARERTPEPVPGRVHANMQTETFLEVIQDRLPEEEVGTQTDALMDRPPTPIFVQRPSGVDAVTQIESNDLFDFDYEVAPILEVLVGKTIETALREVAQEEELASIRARQVEFQQVRNAELAEAQRLEAEVKRRVAEKNRRAVQERERVKREEDVQRKVAATAFARSYVTAMRSNVMVTLRNRGYFYDPLRREIETLVLPELFEAMSALVVRREQVAALLVDELLDGAIDCGVEKYRQEVARKAAEVEAARAAEEAAAALAEAARLERVAARKRKQEEEAAAAAAAEAAEAAEATEE